MVAVLEILPAFATVPCAEAAAAPAQSIANSKSWIPTCFFIERLLSVSNERNDSTPVTGANIVAEVPGATPGNTAQASRRESRVFAGAALSRALPANLSVAIVDEDDLVLLDHRHEHALELALPEIALVELRLHRLARRQIGEPAHEEERVGILDGLEGPDHPHADLGVRRHRFRPENLEEAVAQPGLDPVGPHLDDHRRYFRLPGVSRPPWCSTRPVTLPEASLTKVIWASRVVRKNSVSDSGRIFNFPWPVA